MTVFLRDCLPSIRRLAKRTAEAATLCSIALGDPRFGLFSHLLITVGDREHHALRVVIAHLVRLHASFFGPVAPPMGIVGIVHNAPPRSLPSTLSIQRKRWRSDTAASPLI